MSIIPYKSSIKTATTPIERGVTLEIVPSVPFFLKQKNIRGVAQKTVTFFSKGR